MGLPFLQLTRSYTLNDFFLKEGHEFFALLHIFNLNYNWINKKNVNKNKEISFKSISGIVNGLTENRVLKNVDINRSRRWLKWHRN